MESYYFILGRENKISQKELLSVLAGFGFCFDDINFILSQEVLEINLQVTPDKVADLINVLGGTVKIYQKISPRDVKLFELLKKENISKKVIFAVSNYSAEKLDIFRDALTVKKALRIPIRIIAGKEDGRLSSAQSFQYKMADENIEYGVFDTGWARLIAVQNIDEWTRHDYGKPKSDAVSGMLPPKLARMMVNIVRFYSGIKDPLLLDPFCGSGNVLIEGVSLGLPVKGSDISEKAVADTLANLSWFDGKNDHDIKIADATKFDYSIINQNFIIATEPFLGQPRKAKLRVEEENQAKGEISRLYIDFLKQLKETADSSKLISLVLVFPLFELANGKKLSIFNECVDTIADIGYTSICPPLWYGRDYQVVKREIVILKLSKNGT
jgi:tRNA G10  N-methylase Trm11